jgi:glycerophosphoryl diester phosphodiesterase
MHVLLDPARRPVVAHRGNRAHAPENTVESFRQAIALGVDAIELDVHVSRDGEPVVIHDPTLDRTTDGRGAVAARTVAELQRLDAGARFTADGGRTFPYRGRGITVPTLEEVLALTRDLPLIVELKAVAAAQPALRMLERAGALGRVLVGSFADAALLPFQRAGIPVSGASRALARLYLPAVLGHRPRSLPFQAMCVPRFHHGLPLPVRGLARLMRAAGGTAHVWTVNDPARAVRLWTAGVNGIISDDPGAILACRASTRGAA